MPFVSAHSLQLASLGLNNGEEPGSVEDNSHLSSLPKVSLG
jgi:hypothetical protein